MSKPMITVSKDKGIIFYHVMDDTIQYLDLTGIKRNHPELQEHISSNCFELQREFLQAKESFA